MVDIVREAPLTPSDGNEVSVVAPAAGVGGYEWSLQIDPAIGRLLRQELEPAGAGFGAGPRTRFTVSLENDAHGSLRLILKRSWRTSRPRSSSTRSRPHGGKARRAD